MTETQKRAGGRKRIIIAAGSLLGVAALATAAAFTDIANINLGSGVDGAGIGGSSSFNIQVVASNGLGEPKVNPDVLVPTDWQEANTSAGVNFKIPGASTMTPGDTVTLEIPFRNQSPVLSAKMDFDLKDEPLRTSAAEIRDLYEYTVEVSGTPLPLLTAGTQDQAANLNLGTLAAGEVKTVKLTITLPDQGSAAANNALQGKLAYVQAHFDAESVVP